MQEKKYARSRADLQRWYVRGLAPKLAEAGKNGVVEAAAVAALDNRVRSMLGLTEKAA
jgi:hypothetical protein